MLNLPSKSLEQAVAQLSKLPGIGNKSALRLALHILKEDELYAKDLATSIAALRLNVKYCKKCHNISDEELCGICKNPVRDINTLCVVENMSDVLAIESTGAYKGIYHVLNGVISPLQGITPMDLTIEHLIDRIHSEDINEVIFALNASLDGDTTAFFIRQQLNDIPEIKVTNIARGIPVGGALEYADELTLGRSISERTDLTQ
ncbi:recombination mediator RecR [Flammeovirga kamogawensis]|uniref:Recombination protein RecR n=1 Tax=Flammeovirga kamogawensis TaxID=373891 RepID=A0ABX8GUA1_9BACT|nr:recombination mediator RecR [Flammeovirga kamogawensis]MBB6459960.1 recombination protein RecR [Flammeovirga kamogawensis]QWG06989.1 recombination mediator RecR [Flammeovirga kamogawensis]TRX68810.1 recombination protein RecR [Flammeovirga kamogawensis]